MTRLRLREDSDDDVRVPASHAIEPAELVPLRHSPREVAVPSTTSPGWMIDLSEILGQLNLILAVAVWVLMLVDMYCVLELMRAVFITAIIYCFSVLIASLLHCLDQLGNGSLAPTRILLAHYLSCISSTVLGTLLYLCSINHPMTIRFCALPARIFAGAAAVALLAMLVIVVLQCWYRPVRYRRHSSNDIPLDLDREAAVSIPMKVFP
eukprot:NODE_6918_length_808_cov_93.338686_g6682_i0.p1 GENE.NODE_6918_length_808_cov_93.338686_g6682_i0~~NODE_6918_length_808_cov_93.338686_g6682_i0.p1  ORF type:complete len:209 (-),score=22.67 NODE_6918_length_808_cov_93.338686_g6682_i0:87-713(-)